MTHTPGPWKAVASYEGDGTFYFKVFETPPTGDAAVICTAQELHLSQEEMAANAHLIAAAPELLGILEYVAHCHLDVFYDRDVLSRAQAVIAKAKGEGDDAKDRG